MAEPASPDPIRRDRPLTGILLRSVAVLCFAGMAASIKLAATNGVGTIEMLFYRNLFSVPVILFWVLAGPGLASLRTRRIGAHASRAAIGLVSMALNFTAIALLPLALSTAIGFSTPLFATALSALVLGEAVGRHRWAAVLVGFLGVLVVIQPFDTIVPATSLALAIVAAMGVACVHITLRQIGASEPATTTVFWFNLASLGATALLMPLIGHWPPPAAWGSLVAIGLFGGIAQIVMTASLRFAPVATLAPFDYVLLLWTTLLGWQLFATLPGADTYIGGAIIAASGLYIALRERRLRRAEVVTPAEVEL